MKASQKAIIREMDVDELEILIKEVENMENPSKTDLESYREAIKQLKQLNPSSGLGG
jgi:hypothetical protein